MTSMDGAIFLALWQNALKQLVLLDGKWALLLLR